MMIAGLFRPLLGIKQAAANLIGLPKAKPMVINQVRHTCKTHRGAYKRWRKTATGYKHGLQGRKHGNAGFSQRILKKRTGTARSTAEQTNRLKRLMPSL